MPDRSLIDAVLSGDPAAAHAFVIRFGRLVAWVLRHRVRLPPHMADDAFQEVFARLCEDGWRRLRAWRGDGDFAAYLVPVAYRVGLDALRRQTGAENPARRAELPPAGGGPADDRPDPEAQAILADRRCRLAVAVSALDPDERRLYELHFREERSYRDIAGALGITVNLVGVRLHRLREKLDAALAAASPAVHPPGRPVRSPDAGPSPG